MPAPRVNDEWPEASDMRTKRATRDGEHALVEIARAQHGVLTLAQLRSNGLTASAVRSRVSSGRLHVVHRGVYALAPLLAETGRELAAVLACGPGALLSHRSAAARWGIRASARRAIDVTTPRRAGRRRAGIRVHSGARITDADIARVELIPVTSLARTLLDLAVIVNRRQLERAIERAETLRIFDGRAVEEVLSRSDGQRGAARLRAAFGQPIAPTRNELEEAMYELCRAAWLPEPRVNEWLALPGGTGFRPDFWWREHRLVVETDGFEEHGTRHAFGHDRARDRRLRLIAGIETARFTWDEVMLTPALVAAELSGLLRRAGAA